MDKAQNIYHFVRIALKAVIDGGIDKSGVTPGELVAGLISAFDAMNPAIGNEVIIKVVSEVVLILGSTKELRAMLNAIDENVPEFSSKSDGSVN